MSLILTGNSSTLTVDSTSGITFPNGSNPQSAPSKILQVVQATYSTQTSNSTNVFADTGLTASITPLFATSKILVLVHQSGVYKNATNSANAVDLQLLRNSTVICSFAIGVGYTGTAVANLPGTSSTAYLDSPATTSSITYKTQFLNESNNAGAVVQINSSTSTITLLEVAA